MPSFLPFTPPPSFGNFDSKFSSLRSTSKSSDASGVGKDSDAAALSSAGCSDASDVFSDINSSELDPAEKLKLLKKARKLSKVFGEMPSYDAITSSNAKSHAHNLGQPPSNFNSPMAVAHSPDRRPSQPCSQSSPQIHTYPEPVSRTPTLPPGDTSSHKTVHHPSVLPSSLRNLMLSRPSEMTPSLFSLEQVAEQPIASPTLNEASVATPSRRKSMGLASLISPTTETHPPSPVSPSPLKRTQSLRSQRPARRSMDSTREFHRRYYLNFWEDGEVVEKQRFINVRRARKMAQIFGQEPPTELILPQQSRSSSPEPPLVTELIVDEDSLTQLCELGDLSSIPLDPPSSFHQRQRRVVKLTRFFGVDYQDISPSVADMPSNTPDALVDVKVGRKRFWGFGQPQSDLKDANMDDVLNQLRGLKAT